MTARDTRLDGLLIAMQIVAEISGPMALEQFNENTWKMLTGINQRLAEAALKEAEARS